MKLLIVTHREDLSCGRIAEEAGKRGIKVLKILYSDLGRIKKEEFDFCILRYPRGFEKGFQGHLREILTAFKDNQLLDHGTYSRYPYYEDKLFQHKLFGESVRMPEHCHFSKIGGVDIEGFPVVVKERVSGRCKGVFLLNSREEITEFFGKRNVGDYIFEKYLNVRNDIRVIVLNKRVVGSTERRFYMREREGYDGIGVKIKARFEPPQEIREKAIKVSGMMGCDFCGIDFMIDDRGGIYLTECNLTPEFLSSERILGVNIAGKLIEFIIQKMNSQNNKAASGPE